MNIYGSEDNLERWYARHEAERARLDIPRQVEPKTLRYWIETGAYIVTYVGEENTYAINEFGHEVFAKLEG